QALPSAASSVNVPKTRYSTPSDLNTLPRIESGLPFRRSNPSAASLYASTLSPPGSRSISPSGRRSPSAALSATVFDAGQGHGLPENAEDNPGEPMSLLLKAFVPHVAVYASEDTEKLVAEKGFKNGMWELLRPFGERVQGKVSVRDSSGVTRTTEDFSIRFTRFGQDIVHPDPSVSGQAQETNEKKGGAQDTSSRDKNFVNEVETVVERHLSYAESSNHGASIHETIRKPGIDTERASPYYALYLRRLLSGLPITAQETFAHPVACVTAISSRNENPIEELRQLYAETSQGEKRLPPWVDNEYLRYYVLVHDEENGDIERSMSLFEQMKRRLGLHCHLLRLRCSPSVESDDDSIPLPRSDWMTATEELEAIKRSEDDEQFEDASHYIFESDATAIRTFIREMVTQSIVPTMERHMSIWNDQVASRRRGLTGRFMNLSRKWGGFGGGSRSSLGGSTAAKDGYDPSGFYYAAAPEAIMRKLADFAFMLRDWKLAHSTYDLLRPDFSEAKAWSYHAAANEMAALSLLLSPQQITSKTRTEAIDQMLESAFYSYSTRCSSSYGAIRSLVLGLELLRLRNGSSIDDAGRWGLKLLESRVLGNVGDALVKERLAICYASKTGVGSWNWGSRKRKSAAWSILASDSWMQQGKLIPAQRCLYDLQGVYRSSDNEGINKFKDAKAYIDTLQHELSQHLGQPVDGEADGSGNLTETDIEEESEALTDGRARRGSIIRGGLETAPLHGEELDTNIANAPAQEGFD
ncbi:hypothetical protein Golomagni_05467, partial [Golovinomyces magnicellulatus]